MIRVVFNLVLTEMALILVLLFRTPFRKLIISGLDRLKQGRGPLVVKTVAATMLVLFASTLYNAAEIHRRTAEAGFLSQTDEVLMAHRLLEASMIGFSLFLVLIIDRIHNYIRELHRLRTNLEARSEART
ncbi:uncharacterized protein LOC111456500 isoform X1 [Cucurbita moschata]|uniref:Endoplasmic reticulum transmembrane protein n=1 Tax=Cucurbita moschata TaxID=3662 RepID=A0A6J1GQ35_CUCMO|nr:uncharacterized protein LOC111456500 isoform X1 [Cucurbita moschata]